MRKVLPAEAVDAGVVRPEPVAEASVGDAHRPEGLLVGIDRRWEWLLYIFEEDLAACKGSSVALWRQSAEADAAGATTTSNGDHVEVVALLAGDQLNVGRARLDGVPGVRGDECGREPG